MLYLHEANLADLNSPRRGEANEWLPNKNMRPNANTGRVYQKFPYLKESNFGAKDLCCF